MNTLREIGDFVGLGDATPLHPGKSRLPVTLRAAVNRVPTLEAAERASMRALIGALRRLPLISLEVQARNTVGAPPLHPTLHVRPSGGVVLETNFAVLRDGEPTIAGETRVGNGPGEFAHFTFGDPGLFEYEVTRVGITRNGLTRMRRAIPVEVLAERPPAPERPSIAVEANGDGSFVVTGENFLGDTTVHIRVVDIALASRFFVTTSTRDGAVRFPTGKICRLAGPLFFSANDGRSDATDPTGTLWSNTVAQSCPPPQPNK
jgi:hypothetical protein